MSLEDVCHIAPAGGTFSSLAEAGEEILRGNCDCYPHTAKSFILPFVYINAFTEAVDPNTGEPSISSTLGNFNLFRGLVTTQAGEASEMRVHGELCAICATNSSQPFLPFSSQPPLLILHGLTLSKEKLTALQSEYPVIDRDLAQFVAMFGCTAESDYIALVKDVGIVSLEVKGDANAKSIAKASQQHERTKAFMEILVKIVNPACSLPIVKVSVFTECVQPSPPCEDEDNQFRFYRDKMKDFARSWNDVVKCLMKQQVAGGRLRGKEFKKIAEVLCGLRFMKVLNGLLSYRNDAVEPVSEASLLMVADLKVDEAHLSSKATKRKEVDKKPINNVLLMHKQSVFRQSAGLNLMYLTPDQQDLFDNFVKGLVIGPAGCGKTWMLLLKVVDLVKSEPPRKILLVAPYPHTIRCKRFFLENGITVHETDTLPVAAGVTESIILMCGDAFTDPASFAANIDAVLTCGYHMFMDDAHRYDANIQKCSNHIEMLFATSEAFLWICYDQVQQLDPYSSFLSKTGIERIVLSCVLRNSYEICGTVMKERADVNRFYRLTDSNAPVVGHKIHSTNVRAYVLTTAMSRANSSAYYGLCRSFLRIVFEPQIGKLIEGGFALDNILIVLDACNTRLLREAVCECLRDLRILFGTVADQLVSARPLVAVDECAHLQSGEWSAVFILSDAVRVVGVGWDSSYLPSSRARSKLLIMWIESAPHNSSKWANVKDYCLHRYEENDGEISLVPPVVDRHESGWTVLSKYMKEVFTGSNEGCKDGCRGGCKDLFHDKKT